MKKVLLIVSLAALALGGVVQAAGDAEAGKVKSAACAACHGQDGNGMAGATPVPAKLAGQHPGYIVKQLKDFKEGKRNDAIMAGMVAALNDADMVDLAAYFSSNKRSVGVTAEDKLAMGQQLYRAGNAVSGVAACMACHGPTGSGNPQANFPGLSGQEVVYTVKALKDFRSGARSNDAGHMMGDVASKLTDAEIEAVASYIAGLH